MVTKIVTALVLPPAGPLLLMLLGFLLLWRKRRRTARTLVGLGFVTLWALATPVVSSALASSLEDAHRALPMDEIETADAIVVLGGGLGPSAPPRTSADLNMSADRVLHAARLYRAGKAPLIVSVGGYPPWAGDVPSEARETAALLTEWGVPSDAIVMDEGSLNTHENALAAAELLEARGVRRVLLVTSALHMPRAAATFRTTALEVTPVVTDFLVVDGDDSTVLAWIPTSGSLDSSRRALHEWLGTLYYRIRGWAS